METPIPVTLIGGYLGAGKTTLVNHLLRERGERRIAVLVNDFGELPIDDALIESRDGPLLRLAGGCVCCSFGSDLMAALQQMLALQPAPQHILIETSGVALPAAVARMLGLLPGLQLDALLVLADAETLRRQRRRPLRRRAGAPAAAAGRPAAAEQDRPGPRGGAALAARLARPTRAAGARAELPQAGLRPSCAGIGPIERPAARRMGASKQAQLPPELLLGIGPMQPGPRRATAAPMPARVRQPEPGVRACGRHGRAGSAAGRAAAAPAARQGPDARPRWPGTLAAAGGRTQRAGPAAARLPQRGRLVCIALRGELQAERIRAALAACAV